MMRYWFLVGLLSLVASSTAWVPPGTPTSSTRTVSQRGEQLYATFSRRAWLSEVAAAAVGAAAVGSRPSDAWGAATATLEKTPSIKVTQSVCDPSVSTWQNPQNGRTVYLLGTAHISSESAKLAGNLVRDIRPEGVFVELDRKRVSRAGFESGTNVLEGTNGQVLAVSPPASYVSATTTTSATAATAPPPPKRSNPFDFRQKALQAGSAAVGGAIRGMYSKLDSAGFQAGAEFAVAVREGQQIGSKIILGDRDVEETLQRLTEALSKTDLKALMSPDSELEQSMKQFMPTQNEVMLMGPDKEQLDDAEFRQEFSYFVETMKAKENVKLLMNELKKLAPELYQAMVAERDLYMANGLDTLNQFPQIVAVMGIAHVDGVEQNLLQRGWQPVNPKCPKRV